MSQNIQSAEPRLFGDGIHDDTAAIQARLDSGAACVCLPRPEKEYLISKTLKIGSDQELKLDKGSRVKLADGSNCPMLSNRDITNGNRNIKIAGGIWDMNNRGQRHNVCALGWWVTPPQRAEWLTEEKEAVQVATPWPTKHDPEFFTGVCVKLFKIEGLEITGVTIRNPITYGIQLSRATHFTADDITFDYTWGNPAKANMDGFHVDGGCSFGRITNLRGICFDDFVALNATDGSDSPFHGPITDIEIDGIDCDYCHSAVRMLSRSPEHPVKRVSIRNVRGRYYSYGIGLTYFHRDVKERGVMDDIVISDCSISRAEPPADCWGFPNFGAIEIEHGLDIGNLALERLTRDEGHRPDIPTIRIKDDARIKRLTIRDCTQINRTNEPMIFLRQRGGIESLVHENTTLISEPGPNILEDDGPIPNDRPRTKIDPLNACKPNGRACPGPAAPSGLVRVSPATRTDVRTGEAIYRRSDPKILGFSHVHLNARGNPEHREALLLPFTDSPSPVDVAGKKDAYTESARTGYYSVWLTNFNIHVELTATARVGWQRWTFPEDVPRKAYVVQPEGSEACKIEFSEPWIDRETLPSNPGETVRRMIYTFAPGDRPMLVRTTAPVANEDKEAGRNAADASDWDFDKAWSKTLYAWERIFQRVTVDADETLKEKVHTAIATSGIF
ncbi:MAG: hypothetical protein ACOX9C_06305 [Kiritimatiellia bacterium]|jgi:hypothetical protein